MEHYDLIQVLWVEDDEKVTKTYPAKAKQQYGLQLVDFPCWDEAKLALESEYDRWSAIILDAKCKHHQHSTDDAVVFLGEALKDIAVLAKDKNRVIPWYVLTGGDTNEVSRCINSDRLKWDDGWDKNYYSKATDRDELYQRIIKCAQKSYRLQIHEMYSTVFDALKDCKVSQEGCDALEDLLVPIHFQKEIRSKDYNDKFQKARDVLEYIFRSMSSFGILPNWGWDNKGKSRLNFTASSFLLAGSNFKDKQRNREYVSKTGILPREFIGIVKLMVTMIPPFCHSDDESGDKFNKNEYLSLVDGSSFLLKSFSLQLCDVILWYRNYLREHKDKEQNAKNWEVRSLE